MDQHSIELKEKSLSSNLLFSILITIIIGIVNIIYPLLIGLIYGPEVIGNFSVLFYWSTIINIPISNGIAPSISRYIAASEEKNQKKIENIGSKLSIYYITCVVLIYPFLGYFVFKLPFTEILIILVLLTALIFHYLFRNSLQGKEKFSFLFKLEAISFLIFIPLMLFFCILPKYLGWINLINNHYFFIPMIGYHISFVLFISISKIPNIRLKEFFQLPDITKEILLYAFFMGLGGLFSFGISQIQIVVSDLYLNEFEVGVLSFWYAAVAAINIFTVGFRSMLLPRMTNLLNIDKESDSDFSLKLTRLLDLTLVLLVLPLSCLFFIIIQTYPSFLDILTLNKYNMTNYWLIVILLCTREIILLILSPSISYLLSSEKYVKFNPLFSFLNAIITIISWIILVPVYGIFGFAGGLVIGSFILITAVVILIFFVSNKKNGFHYLFIVIFSSLLIGSLYLSNVWKGIFLIIIWIVFSIISLIFGIVFLYKIFKNKDFMLKNGVPTSNLKEFSNKNQIENNQV